MSGEAIRDDDLDESPGAEGGAAGAEGRKAGGRSPAGAVSAAPAADPGAKGRLAKHLVYYTLARLAMFAALTAVIEGVGMAAVDEFPLLLAAVLALVVSLPLSMVLFKSLRLQVNRDIAAVDATRRAHREALEAELRGDGDADGR